MQPFPVIIFARNQDYETKLLTISHRIALSHTYTLATAQRKQFAAANIIPFFDGSKYRVHRLNERAPIKWI